MIVCLSPNGRVQTEGDGPATTLLTATIRGLVVFKRSGPGEAWREDYRSLEHKHISSLLHDAGSGLLFAGIHGRGEEGGLYVSADMGRTWEERETGLPSRHVYCLAAEQRDGQTILYAGLEPPALVRSRDLGAHWEELGSLKHVPGTDKWTFPPPPHIAHVKSVTLHPAQPGTIYALVEQGAVLKSSDDGATWYEIDAYSSDDDSFYRDVHRLAIAPSDPQRMHLATGDGLYFSADGGESWDHQQGRKDRVGYPDALFLQPGDENTVYLGGANDAPETWRTEGGAFPGFIVSHDGGKTWAEAMDGLPKPVEGNIEAMAMHHSPAGTAFFAGTAVGQVWTSEDAGKSWSAVALDLPPISKARHYRHFLPAEEKLKIEEQARAERRAEGLADKEYRTNP